MLVHHDCAPQCSVASDLFGDITQDQCGLGLLNPCIAVDRECDDVEVGGALMNERQESANSSPGCLHVDL